MHRLYTLALSLSLMIASSPVTAEAVFSASGPSGRLEGIWRSVPAPDAPVMLIVPGSGPTDRDGNNPGGVQASTYRFLAAGLAARGIASVRIDKRGLYGSRAAAADPDAVTLGDYADDVRAWIAAIRERAPASCIWLLGHSEGALVALKTAQNAPDVCGLVLIAAPGRRPADVLRDQLRANPANASILGEALAILARLERGQRVDGAGMTPALRPLFRPEVQGFLASLLPVDPKALIATARQPVLIIQGLRDIQIGREDAEALKGANMAARLVLLPDVNHVLKTVASDDRPANVAAYLDPNRPLASGVIDAIASTVEAVSATR